MTSLNGRFTLFPSITILDGTRQWAVNNYHFCWTFDERSWYCVWSLLNWCWRCEGWRVSGSRPLNGWLYWLNLFLCSLSCNCDDYRTEWMVITGDSEKQSQRSIVPNWFDCSIIPLSHIARTGLNPPTPLDRDFGRTLYRGTRVTIKCELKSVRPLLGCPRYSVVLIENQSRWGEFN